MPVQWSVREPDGVLLIEGHGVVTDEQYFRAHADFFAASTDPRLTCRTLADWSGVTELVLSSEAIRRSVQMTGELVRHVPGEHRVALIATAPAVFGMCRMWQTLIEQVGVEANVFGDRVDAERWLLAGATRVAATGGTGLI